MISNYYPTEENPLATIDNVKSLIKKSKASFASTEALAGKVDSTALETLATKAELANYATTEALNAKADTASVTALEGRIAAIETEITGVAASLASLIGG